MTLISSIIQNLVSQGILIDVGEFFPILEHNYDLYLMLNSKFIFSISVRFSGKQF